MEHRRLQRLIWGMILVVLVGAGAIQGEEALGQAKGPFGQGNTQAAPQEASRMGPLNDEGQPVHWERLDDPPLGAVRADPSARSKRGKVVRGPFVSVQVNVDEFGQNIVGDAANEPSIAVDPTDPDRIVIGWRQFDTISSNFRQGGWSYSHDGGQSWTFPGVLTPGTFRSDPVLDFDAGGNFYYFSLKGDFTCDMFISNNSGVSWQGPYPAWGGDKNWLGIDRTNGIGQGNLYCTWSGNSNFTRSTDGGLTYLPPIPSHAYWNTISVAPNGKLYICGWAGNSDYDVQRSSNAQNSGVKPSWDLSVTVNLGGKIGYYGGPNPGGLLGQVWIATNHAVGAHHGEVYLLASVNPPSGDPLDVHIVRSTDEGLTWSNPIRVNDDPTNNGAYQWFGTMSVAPNGRLDVVWNDTRNSGQDNICELYYAYSYDGGRSWSENVPVTPSWNSVIGWPQQDKIGDYYDMVSHDAWAHVAFAATFNGEQDVYYVKVYPDIPLMADAEELSASTGGTVQFSLNGGTDNMGRSYALLGSVSGTSPGLPLPGGLATLPLNWDVFTGLTYKLANTPVFESFQGQLDASGLGSAKLDTMGPLLPAAVGVTMDFAYLLYPPFDYTSNPVAVDIVP